MIAIEVNKKTCQAVSKIASRLEEDVEGFAFAADTLRGSEIADTFDELARQREDFLDELLEFMKDCGIDQEESAGTSSKSHWWTAAADVSTDEDLTSLLEGCLAREDKLISLYQDFIRNTSVDESLREIFTDQVAEVQSFFDDLEEELEE